VNALLLLLWLSCCGGAPQQQVRTQVLAIATPAPTASAATTRTAVAASQPFVVVAPAILVQGRVDRWIAPDKLQHFLLSMAVTSFSFGAADLAGADDDVRMGLAVSAAAVAGIAKELVDLRGGAWFSAKDLAWDALGILAAAALLRSAR